MQDTLRCARVLENGEISQPKYQENLVASRSRRKDGSKEGKSGSDCNNQAAVNHLSQGVDVGLERRVRQEALKRRW